MGLKKLFDRYKNYSTQGYPDIFWPWIIESTIIIVVSLVLTYLIFNYLKLKGIL